MSDPDPHGRGNAEAVPAATLILLRGGHDRDEAEVLMVRRAGHMVFAPGALAFPGGRVEADDCHVASALAHGLEPEDAAARIAVIRETLEEAGVAVGFIVSPVADRLSALRARMHEGELFGALLAEFGVTLDLDAIVPFARWCPPAREKLTRRFDTRFYVAVGGDGLGEGAVDGTENDELRWDSPRRLLAACEAGTAHAIFPTLRNLERLALCASPADVLAVARRYPIELIEPWVEPRDGVPHLCIPEHLGYPVTAVPLDLASRS